MNIRKQAQFNHKMDNFTHNFVYIEIISLYTTAKYTVLIQADKQNKKQLVYLTFIYTYGVYYVSLNVISCLY